MSERTLVILKPDAVEQKLVDVISSEFGRAGLLVCWPTEITLTREMLAEHYAHHASKPYFPRICAYMMRGPCVVMIVKGPDAVKKVRDLAGATRPTQADPNSLRGRFGKETPEGGIENILHASESPEDAATEIRRFYGDEV